MPNHSQSKASELAVTPAHLSLNYMCMLDTWRKGGTRTVFDLDDSKFDVEFSTEEPVLRKTVTIRLSQDGQSSVG